MTAGKPSREADQIQRDFADGVNMTAHALREWLKEGGATGVNWPPHK